MLTEQWGGTPHAIRTVTQQPGHPHVRSHADLWMSEPLEKPARIQVRVFNQIFAIHGRKRCYSDCLQTVSHGPLLSRYRPLRQNLIQGVLVGFTGGGRTKSFVMRELRLADRLT